MVVLEGAGNWASVRVQHRGLDWFVVIADRLVRQ